MKRVAALLVILCLLSVTGTAQAVLVTVTLTFTGESLHSDWNPIAEGGCPAPGWINNAWENPGCNAYSQGILYLTWNTHGGKFRITKITVDWENLQNSPYSFQSGIEMEVWNLGYYKEKSEYVAWPSGQSGSLILDILSNATEADNGNLKIKMFANSGGAQSQIVPSTIRVTRIELEGTWVNEPPTPTTTHTPQPQPTATSWIPVSNNCIPGIKTATGIPTLPIIVLTTNTSRPPITRTPSRTPGAIPPEVTGTVLPMLTWTPTPPPSWTPVSTAAYTSPTPAPTCLPPTPGLINPIVEIQPPTPIQGRCYTIFPRINVEIPSINLLVFQTPAIDVKAPDVELCLNYIRITAKILNIDIGAYAAVFLLLNLIRMIIAPFRKEL